MHRYDIVARMETFSKDSTYIINRYFNISTPILFRIYFSVIMDGDGFWQGCRSHFSHPELTQDHVLQACLL